MSTPSPAALAAAEEIWNVPPPGRPSLQYLAEIIDRHMVPKPIQLTLTRYFTNGYGHWEWDGEKMEILNPREDSMFETPEEIIDQTGIYETDEFGRRLSPEPEGGEE